MTNGFTDTFLLNNSIPGLAIDEIDLSQTFLGKNIAWPLMINAITGGTERARGINQCLASLAGKYNIPMAVGSLNIAIEDPDTISSFAIVREKNPQGLILANIGADEPPDKAVKAVKIIDADALQLHFNVPQEIAMEEGERSFKNVLVNVEEIAAVSPVPVIAKEVGFGFSRETVEKLFACGIRIFDNGGQGGTNFITIENQRSGLMAEGFEHWGIPTAWSLGEIKALQLPIVIIASGGIRTPVEAAKAIAMGADMIGLAAPFLKAYVREGEAGVESYLQGFLYGLQAAALMTGSRNLAELSRQPLIIMGQTAEWLRARGIDPGDWTSR